MEQLEIQHLVMVYFHEDLMLPFVTEKWHFWTVQILRMNIEMIHLSVLMYAYQQIEPNVFFCTVPGYIGNASDAEDDLSNHNIEGVDWITAN